MALSNTANVLLTCVYPARLGLAAALSALSNLVSTFSTPALATVVSTVCTREHVGSTVQASSLSLLGCCSGSLLSLIGASVQLSVHPDGNGTSSLVVTALIASVLIALQLSVKCDALVLKFASLVIIVNIWSFFSGSRSIEDVRQIALRLLSCVAGAFSSVLVSIPVAHLLLSERVKYQLVPSLRQIASATSANLRCSIVALSQDETGAAVSRAVRASVLLDSMNDHIMQLPQCKSGVSWEPTHLSAADVDALFRFWSSVYRSLNGLLTTLRAMCDATLEHQGLEHNSKQQPVNKTRAADVLYSLIHAICNAYDAVDQQVATLSTCKIPDSSGSQDELLDALAKARLYHGAYAEEMLRGSHFIEALHTHIFLLWDTRSLLASDINQFAPSKTEPAEERNHPLKVLFQCLSKRLPTKRAHITLVLQVTLALLAGAFLGALTFSSGLWVSLTIVFVGISFEEGHGQTVQQSALRIQGTVAGSLIAFWIVALDPARTRAADNPGVFSYVMLSVFTAATAPLRRTDVEYGAVVASFTSWVIALTLGNVEDIDETANAEAYACDRIEQNVIGVVLVLLFEFILSRQSASTLLTPMLAGAIDTLNESILRLYDRNAKSGAVLETTRSLRLQLHSVRHVIRSGSAEARLNWQLPFPRTLYDGIVHDLEACRIACALLRKTTEYDWKPVFTYDEVQQFSSCLQCWIEYLKHMLQEQMQQADEFAAESSALTESLLALQSMLHTRLQQIRMRYQDESQNASVLPPSRSLTLSLATLYLSRELEKHVQSLGSTIRKLVLKPEHVLAQDHSCCTEP